jgi:hypothetical protein
MLNFEAKERETSPSTDTKPGDKIPVCDPDHMTYMGDSGAKQTRFPTPRHVCV